MLRIPTSFFYSFFKARVLVLLPAKNCGRPGYQIMGIFCPHPMQKPSPDPCLYSSSLWGPTGDGLDHIADSMELPELHVGDWLIFENMGAHMAPASSTFIGVQQAQIHYAMSRVAW